MANNTYIGINPNSLVRTESGELSLYVNGAPVAFFSSSADVVFSGSLGIDGVSDISASLAGMISGVSASNGLLGGGPSGVVNLSLDTGSLHFIEGVLQSGLFRLTGSVYSTANDIAITGSLDVNFTESDQEFRVASQSITQFSINNEGVAVFATHSITPTFVSGGIYYGSDGQFYFGTGN